MSALSRWDLSTNPLAAWVAAGSIFLVLAAGHLIGRRLLARRLARLAAHTPTAADDIVVELVARTWTPLVLVLALTAATLPLELPPAAEHMVRVGAIMALVLQGAIWGNALISLWLRYYASQHGGASAATLATFAVFARIATVTLLVLLALNNLGIDITALVTGLGIGGIAIALAAQNILSDLFGALSIVVDRPFVVGDCIELDAYRGTVEHIGLKSTRLRSVTGEQIVLANADLLKGRVRNFRRMQERRASFRTVLARRTAPDAVARVPRVLAGIVASQPQVRFEYAHLVRVSDAGLEFETVYHVTTPDELVHLDVQQAIQLAVLERLPAAGLELALAGPIPAGAS